MAPELAKARLARLAATTWLEDFACDLMHPERSHGLPKVAAFRAWVLAA